MTVTRVVDEDKKERQQKRIVLVLFSVCILGFSYLVYDYFHIVNHTALPQDFAQVDQSMQVLQKNGLVDRFEPSKARFVVDEAKWNQLTKEEKIGLVAGFARYFAKDRKEEPWSCEVVGNRTSSVVGELGSRGLVIQ